MGSQGRILRGQTSTLRNTIKCEQWSKTNKSDCWFWTKSTFDTMVFRQSNIHNDLKRTYQFVNSRQKSTFAMLPNALLVMLSRNQSFSVPALQAPQTYSPHLHSHTIRSSILFLKASLASRWSSANFPTAFNLSHSSQDWPQSQLQSQLASEIRCWGATFGHSLQVIWPL